MEPVEIFIDATEWSVVVFCGECSVFREVFSTATEAKNAGRKHRNTEHAYRRISIITIHGE